MSIVVSCGCGKSFRASPNLAGTTVACPGCRNSMVVPTPQPIRVICVCGQNYLANADLFGKTLNCPSCGNNISVPTQGGAPAPVAAAPAPVAAAPAAQYTPPAMQHPQQTHPQQTQPAKPAAPSGQNWVLIVSVAGGFLALGLILAIGIIAMMPGSDKKETAAAPAKRAADDPPSKAKANDKKVKANSQAPSGPKIRPMPSTPAQPANNTSDNKNEASKPTRRVVKKVPVEKSPPVIRKPIPPLQTSSPAATSSGGQLSSDVLKRVKGATVFIKTTHESGAVGSGSGFLVIDRSLIITNAHVVGMLKPGTKAPRGLKVIFHSGETNEIGFDASIMGIDRASDLAVLVLKADASQKAMLPAPLPISSAAELQETQPVYIFGFPYGEQLGKNITVSKTSVSSLRKDKTGRLIQVQVNGGMHVGNSGGPVVDSGGRVIGVAVAVILGTQVNFAIPGNDVHELLRGRAVGIRIAESTQRQRQLAVPLLVKTIDPLHQIKSVEVEWWMGKPGSKLARSTVKPKQSSDDSQRTSVPASYDVGMAKAELLLPEVAKGKTFFIQAVIVHADGTKLWTASKQYDPPPMVDQQPTLLVNKHRSGTQQINLNSKTVLKFTGYDIAEKSMLAHIDAKLRQTTQVRGRRATKQFGVRGLTFGLSIDGQSPPKTRQLQRMVNDVRFMKMMVTEDHRGNILQQLVDVTRMRPSSRLLVAGLGTKMTESLDAVAIPLPGRTMKPGQTWRSIRVVPIETLGTVRKGSLAMNYTYKGLMTFAGRRSALISLRGALRGHKGKISSLAGRSRGFAVYDVESSRITYVRHVIDISLTITIKDVILKASGMMRVKISRNPT